MSKKWRLYIGSFAVISIFAAQKNFVPDAALNGSTLAGWHTLGGADWRAEKGELVGTPKQGGGWLVLDHSYQDVGVYTQFRCTGGCETGVLLRAAREGYCCRQHASDERTERPSRYHARRGGWINAPGPSSSPSRFRRRAALRARNAARTRPPSPL